MPASTYLERAVLDQIVGGGELAQVSTAILATTPLTTSIATATAGHTVAEALTAGDIIVVSAGTANAETYVAAATAAGATSITVTSQTNAKLHAIGDIIVRLTTRTILPATLYVGMSTGLATAAVAEPTIGTGGYARVGVTGNLVQWPAATGAAPASKSNANTITFPASTGAWSSGATALQSFFLADAATGGNVLLQGNLANAQTVNAAGITLSFAATALTATAT